MTEKLMLESIIDVYHEVIQEKNIQIKQKDRDILYYKDLYNATMDRYECLWTFLENMGYNPEDILEEFDYDDFIMEDD